MKIAVVTLTGNGVSLGKKIASKLSGNGHETEVYLPQEFAEEKYRSFSSPLRDLMKRIFEDYDGLVCIMAMGIVVRLIAPLLQSKLHDPAVVVIDELGQNVISVLSGHWGKANDLTREIACLTEAHPVITTATDVNGLMAIDVVARDNGLIPEPIGMVRKINSDIVKGRGVELYTEIPLQINSEAAIPLDKGLTIKEFDELFTSLGADIAEAGCAKVIVTNRSLSELAGDILFLRPRNIIAGIGCRRGVSKEEILAAIEHAFVAAGRSQFSLQALTSVDIKKDEDGLLEAAETLDVPVHFYSKDEINEVMNERDKELGFSETVKDKIGVGGVCEPAAVLKAGQGTKILLAKRIFGRVTIALAEEN